jgi:hypothetical protein
MRKNIASVIDAFHSDESHRELTCSTDGTVIRSYETVIAIRVGHAVYVLDPADSPSRTTTSQIRAILKALPFAKPVTRAKLDGYQEHLAEEEAPVSGLRDAGREDFHADG